MNILSGEQAERSSPVFIDGGDMEIIKMNRRDLTDTYLRSVLWRYL